MNIQNVHIHLGHSGAIGAAMLAALVAGTTPEAQAEPKASSNILVPPAIGEYWKGQGGIYAGVGRGHDSPDYCLILPIDPRAIFVKRMLGTYGIEVPNASSDHDGMANTVALADAGSDLCKEILALEIEGHKDFYLMSRTDARLCWANVPEQFKKEWYLTSTQCSALTAWIQDFINGYQGNSN